MVLNKSTSNHCSSNEPQAWGNAASQCFRVGPLRALAHLTLTITLDDRCCNQPRTTGEGTEAERWKGLPGVTLGPRLCAELPAKLPLSVRHPTSAVLVHTSVSGTARLEQDSLQLNHPLTPRFGEEKTLSRQEVLAGYINGWDFAALLREFAFHPVSQVQCWVLAWIISL